MSAAPIDVEQLLTATRSARKSLDLDAPVDLAQVRECLRIGMHAANGSNQQSWRWLLVSDPRLRAEVAAQYRDAYLSRTGGKLVSAACLPVARLRAGRALRPAPRRPLDEVVAVDRWDGARA